MILNGIGIIDFSGSILGNLAGKTFIKMGSKIIKLEDAEDDNIFSINNEGVKTIQVDINKEEDRSCIINLIKQADIFFENKGSIEMRRLGLDYGLLNIINPRLIYCSFIRSMTIGFYHEWCLRLGLRDLFTMTILAALVGRQCSGFGQHVEISVEYDTWGEVRTITDISFPGTKPKQWHHPLESGEHTEEILKHLGYSQEEINGLRQRNVVFFKKKE